jgi:hypothetical protein
MKKFKNYPDLAVSLLVDLKDKIGGDKVWDGHFYKTIPNYYQAISKNTTDEQDELNLESQIIYISAESFDSGRIVKLDIRNEQDNGSFEISKTTYENLLNQLILEFLELEITKNSGLIRFN